MRKSLSVLLAVSLSASVLAGCGASGAQSSSNASSASAPDAQTAAATTSAAADQSASTSGDAVTLNYWTWFPSTDQAKDVIDAFEKENPNIKINMTVMESKTFQEKAPLALSTNEDIDLIGVQPTKFATQIQDYLADVDPLMEKAVGSNWKDSYSESNLKKGETLTDGKDKFLVLVNSGSVFGYVNMDLLNDIGCKVPTTIEEYKDVAAKLKAKYPDKYAGVFDGKDGWVVDELMLTVLAQQGTYYNDWRYNNASIDNQQYVDAINGLKAFFDDGIFTQDTMDLDYSGAQEAFANGDALVYYMGSWEAPLLSEKLREQNGVNLKNVGVMALPVVKDGNKPAVRGFLDSAIGVVNYSKKQDAAAKFLAFVTIGEGADILSNQLIGPSGKVNCQTDPSLFGTPEEKSGWELINSMILNAGSDRNNVSSFSDVEGAAVQNVINGSATAEDTVKDLQTEWQSGKY